MRIAFIDLMPAGCGKSFLGREHDSLLDNKKGSEFNSKSFVISRSFSNNQVPLALLGLMHSLSYLITDGNAIGTAGAIAPPQKDESILVGTTLTMETILCLIKAS